MSCSRELSNVRRSWDSPKLVASWSEVPVMWRPLNLWLVSEARGVLLGSVPLTRRVSANSRWLASELDCSTPVRSYHLVNTQTATLKETILCSSGPVTRWNTVFVMARLFCALITSPGQRWWWHEFMAGPSASSSRFFGRAHVNYKHSSTSAKAAPGLLFGRSLGPQPGSEASSKCFCIVGIWFWLCMFVWQVLGWGGAQVQSSPGHPLAWPSSFWWDTEPCKGMDGEVKIISLPLRVM